MRRFKILFTLILLRHNIKKRPDDFECWKSSKFHEVLQSKYNNTVSFDYKSKGIFAALLVSTWRIFF